MSKTPNVTLSLAFDYSGNRTEETFGNSNLRLGQLYRKIFSGGIIKGYELHGNDSTKGRTTVKKNCSVLCKLKVHFRHKRFSSFAFVKFMRA